MEKKLEFLSADTPLERGQAFLYLKEEEEAGPVVHLYFYLGQYQGKQIVRHTGGTYVPKTEEDRFEDEEIGLIWATGMPLDEEYMDLGDPQLLGQRIQGYTLETDGSDEIESLIREHLWTKAGLENIIEKLRQLNQAR